jgi:signal transduction histidine kinase
VHTEKKEGGVEIRVSDNGIGVPGKIHDRVFEPCFMTKPAGSGTGLGLSFSYDSVVKGHGGNFRVESDFGGKTAFIITIPH